MTDPIFEVTSQLSAAALLQLLNDPAQAAAATQLGWDVEQLREECKTALANPEHEKATPIKLACEPGCFDVLPANPNSSAKRSGWDYSAIVNGPNVKIQ